MSVAADDPSCPVFAPNSPACRPIKWRRVNRRRQSDPVRIRKLLPRMCMLSAGAAQARAMLRQVPEFARLYSNRRRHIAAVLEGLYEYQVGTTRTAHPGHEALARFAGISLKTVQRSLTWLIRHGFAVLAAIGRQAEFAAAGPDGKKINEAALYALTVPRARKGVDEFDHLPAGGGGSPSETKLTPTRARETDENGTAAPRLIDPPRGASLTPYRPELRWPGDRTAKTPGQRTAAASELRERVAGMRCMSFKDVRSVIRPALLSGWTVRDIQHALDWQPDGRRWPHSGPPVTGEPWRMRGWLRYRLGAWMNESGDMLPSRSQRLESQRREALARKAIERRKALERDAEHAAWLAAGPSPVLLEAKARLRALFRK